MEIVLPGPGKLLLMRALLVTLWVALACTQFIAELVTVYRPDGTVEQVIIEREEKGTLLINTTTGEMEFIEDAFPVMD